MASIKNYQDLLTKVNSVVVQKGLDLSAGEDLSIGVMNLISIEEHLFFTYNKTNKAAYLDLLNEVRLMRTQLMKGIIKEYEGEAWCIGKHLLAASMRVMEVGTKELKKGNKKEARDLFQKSFKLYSLFWGVVLSKDKGTKSNHDSEVAFLDEKGQEAGTASVFAKMGQIINKALDCCRE